MLFVCVFSLQVYLINVTYSDSTSHIIYRRYSKFFDLQVGIYIHALVHTHTHVNTSYAHSLNTIFHFIYMYLLAKHSNVFILYSR